MRARLYVLAASHPCFAAARALELKGIPYRRFEWLPAVHAPMQRLRFGARTVPGLELDGERVVGSRAIMHRLDEVVADPPLYPRDAASRERVEEADRWGDDVLQPIPRRIVWWVLRRRPVSILSYAEASHLPMPAPLTRALVPVIAPISWRFNEIDDAAVRQDLRALPDHLDTIDAWISEGVLGGPVANAADLQVGSSIALLLTLGDLRPMIDGRPALELATRHFPDYPGDVPPGVLPAQWLPAPAARS